MPFSMKLFLVAVSSASSALILKSSMVSRRLKWAAVQSIASSTI